MQKNQRVAFGLVLMASILFFTVSCAKNMNQTEEGQVSAPPEVSAAQENSQNNDAQLQKERLKAEAASRKAAEAAFVEEKVPFSFDSAVLSEQARMILNKKADFLRSSPATHITVEGYCDERGSDEYNLALGQRRADSVRTFLIDTGIAADRMKTVSFGENKPIATGHDEESWALNRRAEFVIN